MKLDSGNTPIRQAPANIQAQMSDVPLFTAPVPVTTQVASNAYKRVVSLAGYNNVRDAVDVRIINDVVQRRYTNSLESQSQVGGWPALNTYNVPVDSDQDGMPDYWETANRMNSYAANNNHTNASGYTDLEDYLNWLAGLHAVCSANSSADINLRTFTGAMASNAVYAVSNGTNGTVSILGDGRTARFTPARQLFWPRELSVHFYGYSRGRRHHQRDPGSRHPHAVSARSNHFFHERREHRSGRR